MRRGSRGYSRRTQAQYTHNQSEEKDAQDKDLELALVILFRHWQVTQRRGLALRAVTSKGRSVHSLKSTFLNPFKSSPHHVQTENSSGSASTDSMGRWHAGREHCFGA